MGQGGEAQCENVYDWILGGRVMLAYGGAQRIGGAKRVPQARICRGDFICAASSGYSDAIRPYLLAVGAPELIPPSRVYGSDTTPSGAAKADSARQITHSHGRAEAVLVDTDRRFDIIGIHG